MLLFSSLNDQVIDTLTTHPSMSIQELHTLIKQDSTISLPNFYKYIHSLLKNQILIKEGGKLSLHNRRVLGIVTLADNLKQSYGDTKKTIHLLHEWEALYHEASSIEALDGVRWDWMLQVNKIYGNTEPTYVYQARPYYALGMHKTEMAFFKEANKVASVFFLTWNTSFLDLHGANEYKKIGISALATNDLPFLKKGYCTTVVGEYVFEVLFPKEISDYFDIFFESITDLNNFKPELFYRIFTMKANCKLTLRKDSMQSAKIKEIFIKAFKKEVARLK